MLRKLVACSAATMPSHPPLAPESNRGCQTANTRLSPPHLKWSTMPSTSPVMPVQ